MKWPPRDLHSSENCLCCRFCLTSDFLSHVGRATLPAGGEDFQADIAAGSAHSSHYSASTPSARRMGFRSHTLPVAPWYRLFPAHRQGLMSLEQVALNRGRVPTNPPIGYLSTRKEANTP